MTHLTLTDLIQIIETYKLRVRFRHDCIVSFDPRRKSNISSVAKELGLPIHASQRFLVTRRGRYEELLDQLQAYLELDPNK